MPYPIQIPKIRFAMEQVYFLKKGGEILLRYKLASSGNLYRFPHFLDLPFGPISQICLLGKHPQTPLTFSQRMAVYFLTIPSERKICI